MLAAPNKVLVDFGFRRAHGAEAGLMAARASYLVGFAGTATVLAGKEFGIPVYGTMAHSFIELFDDEIAAFTAFAQARPNNLVLLIDTYDTEAAARKVVALAPKLKEAGIAIRAVRLDLGDLVALSRSVRAILDAGGLRDVTIFASGGLDEDSLIAFAKANAPIDGFGIGTSMTTSSDVPSLDVVYKLQDYAGVARRKRSANKATWPGRKQVWRRYGADGRMIGDTLSLEPATTTNRRAAAAAGHAEWPAACIRRLRSMTRGVTPKASLNVCPAFAPAGAGRGLSGRGCERATGSCRGGRPPHARGARNHDFRGAPPVSRASRTARRRC